MAPMRDTSIAWLIQSPFNNNSHQYAADGRRADVICYAFSPDLLDASTKELLSFLKILSQYFPKTDNGDGRFRPMDNQSYIDTFNSAHQHVCELIAAKRAQARHR